MYNVFLSQLLKKYIYIVSVGATTLGNARGSLYIVFLKQISSTTLLVANQAYTKSLQNFKTLCPGL